MIRVLKNYLQIQTGLTNADLEHIVALAQLVKLAKNDFLLREGKVCRHKAFIAQGMLRTFGAAADGSEHILQFSPENTWTLDVESYDKQLPSIYNICAVESTEVWLWNKADFTALLKEFPALKAFSERLISNNIYSSRQRLLSALSASPEEKYQHFVDNNPGLLARIPLWMIASYLGISLKTLTRLRHAQLQR